MGASTFHTVQPRDRFKDAGAAFWAAVDQAAYDYGHAGYTGTIAEKDGYHQVAEFASDEDAHAAINAWINDGYAYDTGSAVPVPDDHPYHKLRNATDDKWGPANLVVTPKFYHFFGWASC